MEKLKRKHGDKPLQVFKSDAISPLRFIIIAISVALFFMLFHEMFEAISDNWFFFCMVPIYAITFFLFFANSTQSLHIYEDGIEQRYGSRRSFVPWEDMIAFGLRSKGKRSFLIGIITRHPIYDEDSGNVIEKLLHWRIDKKFMILSPLIKAPTESDGWFKRKVNLVRLQHTEFGQIVSEYAPQLFEEGTLKWKKLNTSETTKRYKYLNRTPDSELD